MMADWRGTGRGSLDVTRMGYFNNLTGEICKMEGS